MKYNRKQTSWLMGLTTALLIALLLPSVTLAAGGPPPDRGNAASGQMGTIGTLDEATEAALVEALEEEYGALALYQGIIADFGEVAPFVAIARSEQQHVNALLRLFSRYELTAPAAPAFDTLPSFDTLEAACEAGVAAEIADAALYDTLLESVSAPNVVRVFTRLQAASLEQHLPAFEACASGEPYVGEGPATQTMAMNQGQNRPAELNALGEQLQQGLRNLMRNAGEALCGR